MAGLGESGNEPPGSLKAIFNLEAVLEVWQRENIVITQDQTPDHPVRSRLLYRLLDRLRCEGSGNISVQGCRTGERGVESLGKALVPRPKSTGASPSVLCANDPWVRAFRQGRESVFDLTRYGHSQVSDEDVQTVSALVETVREITIVLYHPSYPPDLSFCDFDLIPKMKDPLRRIRFRTDEDALQATDHSIRIINRLGSANGIQRLPYRWEHIVRNAGDCIEGL
ncbi:hypothetical protein ANN_04526 [Periplaneta americana]|uniref:Uncharacterized protein n=1 Tax=Periplaneta americana TaxID=6978 RepID=A0ABQ8T8W5_PERAM|nr:hypothetical protein ANN_04526 [Periplaneta americana]